VLGRSCYGFLQLVLFALLLGVSGGVQAVQVACSDAPYNGLIDGNVYPVPPANIKIDVSCTIQNFPASNPLGSNFSFDNAVPLLAIFDNVIHTGQMSCNTGAGHKIWFTNGSVTDIPASCQNFVIPAETIDKQPPAGQTSAGIGDPFTYTLTLPSMQFPAGAPSPNELTDVVIWDDLNATGADIGLVGLPVVSLGGAPLTQGVDYTFSNVAGLLTFNIPTILIGDQIVIEITAVLNDTGANVIGSTFTNTAKWQFVREIDVNSDGFIDPLTEIFTLPGEWGIATMVIAEPNLVVTKTADQTTLNFGVDANFTIDIHNNGGGDAWNVTMLDRLPVNGVSGNPDYAGMCVYDPTTGPITAQVFSSVGVPVTGAASPGALYTATYDPVACELDVTMTSSLMNIGPSEYLRITFQSKLDPLSQADPFPLINIAAATQWFSGDPGGAYPVRTYTGTLTDGTPGVTDHEDDHTITTTLSGYFFQKTVENRTTLENPAVGAAPGDLLRYRLRLFNLDQTFKAITIEDVLDTGLFDIASVVPVTPLPLNTTFSVDSGTGTLTFKGFGVDLDSAPVPPATSEIIFEFDVNLLPTLTNGTVVPNQAILNATNEIPAPVSVESDDPYINGISLPYDPGDTTDILIQSPGALSKVNTQATATIGEQFTYTITVPATPVAVPLYDVRVLDDLTVSSADMNFVSAAVIAGGAWTLSNTGTATFPVIEDLVTGIDIPAGGQAVIEITVELANTATNINGLNFSNIATYTYNRSNGATQTNGVAGVSTNMTVVESSLSATKTVTNVTPAKLPTSPVTDGDILQYVLTVTNDSATAMAYDVNVVDILPAELALVPAITFLPTATINGVPVVGFEPTPTGASAGPLIWGNDNLDGSLDIPPGGVLILTYQVQVTAGSNAFFSNEAWVDWSSLDGSSASERTGAGCPTVVTPNDYCFGPATVTSTLDNNSLSKAVIANSWITDGSTALDATVRVGDTATYQLTMNLGEGTNSSVTVSDVLPAGMVFDSLVSISPASGGASFTYTLVSEPIAGDAGTLVWDFGNIINVPSGDGTPTDALVIEYSARVIENDVSTIAQTPTSTLTNTATLAYLVGGIPVVDPARLVSSSSITVQQPILDLLSKTDRLARASPFTVNIATDVMQFRVSSCNTTGLSPAYNVQLTDVLAAELNEASIAGPTNGVGNPDVYIGGVLQTAGVNYSYTAPAARGGNMAFQLITPVAPGQCVDIDYNIGFYTDIPANSTWNNSASVDSYYSVDGSLGQIYPALAPVIYTMSNTAVIEPPTKTTLSPVSGEATIGEEIVYQITVPSVVRNAAMFDVNITDTLASSLIYVSAIDTSANAFTLNDTSVLPGQVNLNITQIPAGQQAIIELRTRVDNTTSANAGNVFSNTTSYTFADISGGLQLPGGLATTAGSITVVEPLLTTAKVSTNISNPGQPPVGGDILEYVVTLTNTGSSTAFDTNVVDTLPAELQRDISFTATALINGVAAIGFNATPANDPAGPLIWGQGNADGSLDIPVGQSLVLTYRAIVDASVQANTTISNSVWADWTSLNTASGNERSGAGCPAVVVAPNDYCSGPAIATVITPDTNTLTKSVINDSFAPAGDATVRIGDIATYRLALTLQEGLTRNVAVTDVLPAGMVFVDVVSINGDTVADYTSPASGVGSNFAYATITAANIPAGGASGTLNWTLGNINNDPLGDASTEIFVIEYRARVIENNITTIAQAPTTVLNNTATLSYIDAAANPVVDPLRLVSSSSLTVLQPVMDSLTKTDRLARASPFAVDIINDTMEFRVSSCNTTGLSPAYNVQLTDVLAAELNETTISGPANGLGNPDVYIGGVLQTAGVNYIYTAPATRGGSMLFQLITPVASTLCVDIDYNIGFYNDIVANSIWANSVSVDGYYSLDGSLGQSYSPLAAVVYTMTNTAIIDPLAKITLSPLTGEATIGEEIVYQITVPQNPKNAAMHDINITDTLNSSLIYVSATEVSGNGFVLNDTSVLPGQVNLNIVQIPVGQQAVIEVRARVDNTILANAGSSFTNTANYTFANTSGGPQFVGGSGVTATSISLTEPLVTLTKAVSPALPPTAGDILRYTLTLTASGGVVADDFSNAFDVSIVDGLGLGLAYNGNPAVTGALNTIAAPVIVGDGVSLAQTLSWSLADGNADIDIDEGTVVTVSYDVIVLDGVLAGQVLSNSAVAQWTSVDGNNANERDGSATPVVNDYLTLPAVTVLTTPNTNAITKSVLNETFAAIDGNVRIGDVIDYELRLNLQEGISPAVTLVDALPQGLQFEDVVSVNGVTVAPYAAVAPFSHSAVTVPSIVGNALTGPTTVTWNIGDITNAGDNNPANNDFVIVYRARVLNGVLLQTNSTILTNSVDFSYSSAAGTTTLSANAVVTGLQPLLTVTKTAVTAGIDTIIDANELITYTVNIANSGTAPAYDTVLQDIIPVGLRNGAATITMVSNSLLVAGTTPANIIPAYDPATGIATWNFDSGIADQYSIPAGDTLQVVYQLQAEPTLSASMTLTNQAQVQSYYSFDNNAVPTLGTVSGVRQVYGPGNIASTTLTTAGPNPLSKQNPAILTAAVGDSFTYRITVPVIPMTTALNDVRILDDLTASAADLGFVSVTRISGSQVWTPANTGTINNLVIEDITNGIDIPAGEQVVIDITVVLNDSAANVSGLLFNNSASYTFNQVNDNAATQTLGGGATTADMTIIGPDTVTMTKTGPAQMNPGIVEVFTLNAHNTGTAAAWDLTITDILPNPVPGGMCDTPPANISAQIFLADGVTAVTGVLVENVDYTSTYAPAPNCTLTLTMTSALAALPADNRLIVTYEALLDVDNPQGTILTNIAGATQWFSADTAGAGATGQIRTYTHALTNGTVGTPDHEDAHSVVTQSPIIQFYKNVANITSGQNPGTIAQPGDTLRYSLLIQNISVVALTNFSVTDEVDRLNASAMFEPGSLTVVTSPVGSDISNTNANGGTNGTGLMDVRALTLDAVGGVNDNLLIEFEVRLAPAITNATVVMNQAQLNSIVTGTLDSDEPVINGPDDPTIKGDEDPTPISIISAPAFEVWKTSQDLTGDPAILVAGDTLRYTITVKNTGSEDAINVQLLDQIPTNTAYLANSTRLNGVAVADAAAGVSALQAGMLINSANTATLGYLVADSNPLANNLASISFDVVVSASAINGSVISNQGFVNGDGKGSGPFIEQVTDDPGTVTIGDPTVDIVGSLPLIDALKTVAIQIESVTGTPGIVDPGDTLRYTMVVSNAGSLPATGVVLVDATPANTTYVANSVRLNGVSVPDNAGSPLIAGLDISSSDLAVPIAGAGTLTPGQIATITFDVLVDAAAATGTIISNQGIISSNEQANEPTDADGIDANGDQVTQIIVGNAQLLSITKEVLVVGGGAALAGGQLEYVIRVTNIGSVPANNIVITDNLDAPVAGQKSYVNTSATLNGLATGVNYLAPILTANYSAIYGDLLPGSTATLRFRVDLNAALLMGTTVTNNAQVDWNAPIQSATAGVSVDIGGIPGVANINGTAWHDDNFNAVPDASEQLLAGWFVDIYRDGVLFDTVVTDVNGVYQANGLVANDITGVQYELRFRAPNASANTAMLGMGGSIFTNSLQQISNIILSSGSNTQNLNLLINPNGLVYNSVMRTVVPGSTLTMLQAATGTPLPTGCFDDVAQQGQVTPAGGYYRFDINFSDPACSPGSDYLINIVAPPSGYIAAPSTAITAVTDASTAAYSVPVCSADAVAATTHCEAQATSSAPATNVTPGIATNYYMHLTLNNGTVPQDSQLFNNHIPIDPDLSNAVTITKTSSLLNATRGQMVPYTITISNTLAVPLLNVNVVDTIPPGFRYVNGSARMDGVNLEPVFDGLTLTWAGISLDTGNEHVIQLLLVVGSGVSEGEYINRVQMIDGLTGGAASPEATATVRVVPDPTFDCTDIIGKVFDDANMNGYQDEAEKGLANARVISARGLIMKTDEHGRFHITCAVVPNQDRGSNFILKLDERSLPSGYRVISENPRVQRATRGKMMKFNFAATIHRVIRLDIAGPVFEKNSTEIRLQWKPRLNLLLEELSKGASILRISYLADTENSGLVDDRIDVIEEEIMKLREQKECCSALTIETEILWRRGGPPSRGGTD